MQSLYAPKVWKLLPILENSQNGYNAYLFNLIVELSGEDKLSEKESYVLKKLKGLKEVSKMATLKEKRAIILECSSLLYKDEI
jgi:hypothetical protein|nr:MAG TPA: hypothetical protein [Caudoviricetes sp.]